MVGEAEAGASEEEVEVAEGDSVAEGEAALGAVVAVDTAMRVPRKRS